MVRRSSRVSRKSRSKVNRKMKRSRKVSRRVNKSRRMSRKRTKRVNKSRRVSRKRTRRVNNKRTKRVSRKRTRGIRRNRIMRGGGFIEYPETKVPIDIKVKTGRFRSDLNKYLCVYNDAPNGYKLLVLNKEGFTEETKFNPLMNVDRKYSFEMSKITSLTNDKRIVTVIGINMNGEKTTINFSIEGDSYLVHVQKLNEYHGKTTAMQSSPELSTAAPTAPRKVNKAVLEDILNANNSDFSSLDSKSRKMIEDAKKLQLIKKELVGKQIDTTLEPYLLHIFERFKILEQRLEEATEDKPFKVIFAGNGEMHALGVGIAIEDWKEMFKKGKEYGTILIDYITRKIKDLQEKYRVKSAQKVEIGPVGNNPGRLKKHGEPGWHYGEPREKTSESVYHVWGANNSNWNLPQGTPIVGEGQASFFNTQKEGVFGIVTSPLVHKKKMGPPTQPSIDNHSFKSIQTLIDELKNPETNEAARNYFAIFSAKYTPQEIHDFLESQMIDTTTERLAIQDAAEAERAAEKAEAEAAAAAEQEAEEKLKAEVEEEVTKFMEKYENARIEKREKLFLNDRPLGGGDESEEEDRKFVDFYYEHFSLTEPILTRKLSELKEKEKREAETRLNNVNKPLFERIKELKKLQLCTYEEGQAKLEFVEGVEAPQKINSKWYGLSDKTLTMKLFNHFAKEQETEIQLFTGINSEFHIHCPVDKLPEWIAEYERVGHLGVDEHVVRVDVESIFPSSEFGERPLQDLIENLKDLKKSTLDGLKHARIVELEKRARMESRD